MLLTKSFYIDVTTTLDVINIGHEVRRAVRENRVEHGQITLVIPNPGAAVAVMESDCKIPNIKKGLEGFLASGVISSLIPKTLVLPVEAGRMSIEPWQEVFLIDYDTSARRREFRVQLNWEQKKENDGQRT